MSDRDGAPAPPARSRRRRPDDSDAGTTGRRNPRQSISEAGGRPNQQRSATRVGSCEIADNILTMFFVFMTFMAPTVLLTALLLTRFVGDTLAVNIGFALGIANFAYRYIRRSQTGNWC